MPCAKRYTREDVNNLLEVSEGRASPVTGEDGHTLEKHVNVCGYAISDRLVGKLKPRPNHPLVTDSQGRIMSESDHRDIWKALNPGMTTADTKGMFRSHIENWVSRSGAFLDRQQAIIVAKFMLNSQDGQAELQKLDDGVKDRVAIKMSLNMLDMTMPQAWKMHYAEHGPGDSDITHLEDFTWAFMLVDKMPNGDPHIQTFYPVK